MPFLEVEGRRRIYYERVGSSGVPLLLIHGWAVDSRCWTPIVPALLDAGISLITFDHRCCGRSDHDFSDVTVQAIADDVVELLDRLDVPRAALNGWSLGGAVAVAAGARLGDRLAALVLTGAATPRYTRGSDFPHGGTVADVRATIDAIGADRAETFRNVARAVFAAPPNDAELAFVTEMFLASGPRASATLLDLAGLDQRALLPAITAPTWVVHGAVDAFVSVEIAIAAAELLANARLSVYPNCGHAPFLEATKRYAIELTAFLDRPQRDER